MVDERLTIGWTRSDRLGLSPHRKVFDLKDRVWWRRSGMAGRAVVSIIGQNGQPDPG
jgi:hypothetical protein